MNLVKVISTEVNDAKERLIKFLRFGKNDVQEVKEATAFGIDGNAPKDIIAVYSPTTDKGRPVILGYINKNQLADVGELRMYSTDSDLSEQFYLHLKNDGTAEFGGDANFMVRYNELKTGFDSLKGTVNTLITAYNSHIHVTTATIGATTTVGTISPTTSTGTPATADISGAKITEIKTL